MYDEIDVNSPHDILKKSPKFMKKMEEWCINIDELDIFELENIVNRYEAETKGDK